MALLWLGVTDITKINNAIEDQSSIDIDIT
jgi:hypothetical protein